MMSSSVKVSVIVPCYKLAHLLPRCLDSLLAQTLPADKWECIVVDDASPDDVEQVVARYMGLGLGLNFKYIRHTVNKYLAASLNTGVLASSGSYIMHLDADNELGPTCLQDLYTALEIDRETDIAYGAVEVVEENGRRYRARNWPATHFDYLAQVEGHVNQIPSTCLYRRKMWDRVCGSREWCRHADDADMWTRATTLGFVPRYVTNNTTLVYYIRADSMSHTVPDWDWNNWVPKRSLGAGQHNKPVPRGAQPNSVFPNARRYPPPAPYISISDPVQVTVIIPCGPGHEGLVINAVDSLWRQDFDYWACIVVRDGVQPLRLPPFVQQIQAGELGSAGPAVARNVGMAAARSPYIMFLDADDYLEPNALGLMWDALHKLGSNSTYVYTDWVDHESKTVHESLEHDCLKLGGLLYHPSTIMVKRGIAQYDEKLDSWEDWDYALQLTAKGVYGVRVPLPLVNVRLATSLRKTQLIEHKESALKALADKWKGVDMPACSSCGGRRYHAPQNVHAFNHRLSGDSNGPNSNGSTGGNGAGDSGDVARSTVEIAFIGDGSPTIRGTASGIQYYFYGTKPVIKDVFEEDAPNMLNLPDFVLASTLSQPVGA